MSKFMEFYGRVCADDSLKAEFARIMKECGVPGSTSLGDLDERVLAALKPLALRAGFNFGTDEALAYFSKKEEDALSDFELEAVAGGSKDPKVESFIHDPKGRFNTNG